MCPLKEIADVFLDRQPRGTRGWGATLQEVHNWLRGAGQSAKCDRIATFYLNADALNGNTDFYQVITEFVTDISDGTQIFISRLATGKTWINSWKNMVLQLAEIKVVLPKVQLKRAGSKKSLLEVSGALIDARDGFWRTYATWIQTRAEDICMDGLRKAQTIYQHAVEHANMPFNEQVRAVKEDDYAMLLCYNNAEYLIPEDIPGLSGVWKEINKYLVATGNVSDLTTDDKNTTTVNVLMADIKSAASSLDIDRISFSIGQRESSLSEVNDLIRRVNFAREAGCDVPDSI